MEALMGTTFFVGNFLEELKKKVPIRKF